MSALLPVSFANLRGTLTLQVSLWFGLLAAFLSIETWIFGQYSYLPLHDAGDGQVPVFYTLVKSIREYGLSYWYPYHLGGVDERVTYSVFHLITPFFMFLPIWLAYAVVLVVQHFLGGVSMYVFCRARFALGKTVSAIAGVAYTSPMIVMFGSEAHQEWWMNNYFEYRLAWGFAVPALPLFCLAIDYAGTRAGATRSAVAAIAIGVALTITSFFIAFWPYILVVLFTYAFTMGRGTLTSRVLICGFIAVVSTLLQLDHILAAGYLYPSSHRAVMDTIHMSFGYVDVYKTGNQSWAELIWTLISAVANIPNILFQLWRLFGIEFPVQIGLVLVVFLAVLVSSEQRKIHKNGMRPILLAWLVFAALIVFAGPIHQIMLHKLPKMFSRLQLGYYAWGVGSKFLIVLALAYALHIAFMWRRDRLWSKVRLAFLVTVGIVPIVYATATYKATSFIHWAQNGSSFANYDSPQMHSLAKLAEGFVPYRVATITGFSTPLSLHPNFANALKFETFDGYENLYPQRFGRYFLATIEPEKEQYLASFVHGFIGKSLDAQHVVSSLAYILHTGSDVRKVVNLDLLGFANVRYLLSPIALDDPRLKLVLSPDGRNKKLSQVPLVARVLHESVLPRLSRVFSKSPSATYYVNLIDQSIPINFGGREIFVYENTLAVPRAFVTAKTAIHPQQEIWEMLGKRDIGELQSVALLEKPLDGFAEGAEATTPPRFVSYKTDNYEIEGVTSTRAILVITNNYSPYWQATVNGSVVPTVPAYGAFTAVPVPAGRFKVSMQYMPPTLPRFSIAGFGQ